MTNCIICLSDFGKSTFLDTIQNDPISCSNPLCNNPICIQCISQVIDFSLREYTLPTCPVNGCDGCFDYKKLSEPDLIKYGDACLQYLNKQNDKSISFKVVKKDLILKLRQERSEFLIKNFPKSIYLIAKICTPEKLSRLNTKKHLDKFSNNQLKCMNTRCEGLLSEELICSACNTQFCKDCEKRITLGHICNTDDIASITLVKESTRCPKCNVAIYKFEGCDYMTCAACNHKFKYSDGKYTNNGSQNSSVILTNPTIFSMTEFIDKTLDPVRYKQLIFEIETANIPKATNTKIINILTKYRTDNDVDYARKAIIKAYDKYNKRNMLYRQYISHINEIETKLVRNELPLYILTSIHSIYCK